MARGGIGARGSGTQASCARRATLVSLLTSPITVLIAPTSSQLTVSLLTGPITVPPRCALYYLLSYFLILAFFYLLSYLRAYYFLYFTTLLLPLTDLTLGGLKARRTGQMEGAIDAAPLSVFAKAATCQE